jgi:hypothetical protein
MTASGYAAGTFQGIPIANLFQLLLQQPGFSRYAVRAIVTDLLENRLGPIDITPPLPRGWRLIFRGRGIAIETADGILDASQVLIKYAAEDLPQVLARTPQPAMSTPAAPANDPVPPEEPATAKDRPASKQCPPPPPQTIPAASDAHGVSKAEREERAISWLAARLKPDDSVPRKKLQAECMQRFDISANRYRTCVWPKARELKGLPPQARAGAKKSAT